MTHEERTKAFTRNSGLEDLLTEVNGILGEAESQYIELPQSPTMPVILVIGAPRSGTTLLMQWLAASGLFAYPTNLLSRFYAAPYLGARIQQLITDPTYSFKDELGDITTYDLPYQSELGKTRGVLQPNEFWYFWRRFIPNQDPEWLDHESEKLIDSEGFRRGVASMQHALCKPLVMKGIILQYNLECLRSILGNVLFIHTRRHPFFNIRSLLNARKAYSGDESVWFSVKPKAYPKLKDLAPVEQVAGQVYHTQSEIEDQFSRMDLKYSLTIEHEALCAGPEMVFDRIREKLKELGHDITDPYTGPSHFEVNNQVIVDDRRKNEILDAWESLSGDRLSLSSPSRIAGI
jgi:Sulfotransferase family